MAPASGVFGSCHRALAKTAAGLLGQQRFATTFVVSLGSATISCCCSSLAPDSSPKGLDRALRALAALPPALCETCLFVIGEDNPKPFLRLARKLGVAGRVRLLPGQDDVVRFLLGADLLLHPAYSESGGIVLLEAAIAGLPVIATGTCGFAHHIERAGAGRIIVEPFNQGHLNETVAAALRNPQQRAQWAANGIRYGQHQSVVRHAEAGGGLH